MRLNQFTDYSLRTLIYLSLNKEQLCTVSEIAEKYKISRNHLVKVVHNLAKEGLIESFKGKGGGIKLAVDESQINLGKIIRKLEQDSFLVECFSEDNKCNIEPKCRLKGILKKAQNNFFKTLEEYTLADIVKNSAQLEQILSL